MQNEQSGTVRVAVVQDTPVAFELAATLARVRELARDASSHGAQLALFPEAFVSAYPRGLGFGTVVGSRTAEGREWFRRYWESSLDVPGPHTEQLGEIARECAMQLVIGVIERDGGTLYCTVLFFAADGTLFGKHRKLMPTAAERLVWGQGDGSTMSAYHTNLGTVGTAICWENYMPMLRQAMYAKGVSLWCAPTVDDREIWQASMRHIAYEGRTFVLSACQYFTRADAPADYDCVQGDDPGTVLIRGGSVIVGPLGDVLAGPVYGQEAVLTAEIDPLDTVRGKYDLDVVGHYARPDVFRLAVDERPRAAVNACSAAPPPVDEDDDTRPALPA